MKRTVICSIPIRDNLKPQVYSSDDILLPASEKKYRYPINSYFEKQLTNEDELHVIMITKTGPGSNFEENKGFFIKETEDICATTGATCKFKEIRTKFSEDVGTHRELLSSLIDELEPSSSIVCDITYGSKDVPILIFNALTFAEKFLECEIENILYGQAVFSDNTIQATYLRDISSLYYLNGITEKLPKVELGKAKELFKTMLYL